MDKLDKLIADKNIHSISSYFNELLKIAVQDVNSAFNPERLSKLLRNKEPLPTDTRQLSSYRTRIGTMLEYAISTALAKLLKKEYGDAYLLTFAAAHQYPDFFVRDKNLNIVLRIEMKAVDADSDEQAARFDAPTDEINPNTDMLLLVGWKWSKMKNSSNTEFGERPEIFAGLVLPAGEIAKERDERLKITGGKIEKGKVFVYSKKKGEFVIDPGNYGKFWRIIHSSREKGQISPYLSGFIGFLEEVAKRAPRNRFRKEFHIQTGKVDTD